MLINLIESVSPTALMVSLAITIPSNAYRPAPNKMDNMQTHQPIFVLTSVPKTQISMVKTSMMII